MYPRIGQEIVFKVGNKIVQQITVWESYGEFYAEEKLTAK